MNPYITSKVTMAKTTVKKSTRTIQKAVPPKGKHSQLGKAIMEALDDIKKGNVAVVRKENVKRELHKFFE